MPKYETVYKIRRIETGQFWHPKYGWTKTGKFYTKHGLRCLFISPYNHPSNFRDRYGAIEIVRYNVVEQASEIMTIDPENYDNIP